MPELGGRTPGWCRRIDVVLEKTPTRLVSGGKQTVPCSERGVLAEGTRVRHQLPDPIAPLAGRAQLICLLWASNYPSEGRRCGQKGNQWLWVRVPAPISIFLNPLFLFRKLEITPFSEDCYENGMRLTETLSTGPGNVRS